MLFSVPYTAWHVNIQLLAEVHHDDTIYSALTSVIPSCKLKLWEEIKFKWWNLVKPSVGRRGVNILGCSLPDICLQPAQWPLKESKWAMAGFWPPSRGPASWH